MDKNEEELNDIISRIKTCPNCKAVVNNDKFCHNCGMNLKKGKTFEETANNESQFPPPNSETQNEISGEGFRISENEQEEQVINKSNIRKKILIFIIIIGVITIFVVDRIKTDNTITSTDIYKIVKNIDNNVIQVAPNYKYSEDGQGRTIATFEYSAHPINIHGDVFTDRVYTDTVTIMFTKKNGVIRYTIAPTKFPNVTHYKDYEDFKIQNNWGKSESLGLSKYAKIINTH